ncbi:MAG TPA: putative baseplate assembly protein [Kaistia sp.]|nr:putative baseplate assembly protein [Kaistia sp.]
MIYHCCDQRRLDVIRNLGTANGIDFVEVLDRAAPPGAPRQQTLFVRLLRSGFALNPANLTISGGERIPDVGILWCAPASALPAEAEAGLADSVSEPNLTLVVRTDSAGDFSQYTLSIVSGLGSELPHPDFDPRLASIEFSFKVECPADFDCAETNVCAPEVQPKPQIDYLAKDYQGFRRLMLDRLALLIPGWTERSAADLGVALVELLAYAADNLSYRQDAIANEAYLATARQRISVRRHARLVDYPMHEGCNARAFVQVNVNGELRQLEKGTQLLTRIPDLATIVTPDGPEHRDALMAGALVFETAHRADRLDERLERLSFYAWGDGGCCLPRGATSATLRGDLSELLRPGDILIFEEVVSPTTFIEGDADRGHRCAVRLTRVEGSEDPAGGLFEDPPLAQAVAVTEIRWDPADALPFALCISVLERPGLEISVARGNIVIVDHGRTIVGEDLGAVPRETMALVSASPEGCSCERPERRMVPPRYRPALAEAPLAHGFAIDALLPMAENRPFWPATSLLEIDPRAATPLISELTGTLGLVSDDWTACRDLMSSQSSATDFVAEMEDGGRARLRFGNDERGKRPDPETAFTATYRVGNGAAGNVGAETIAHVVSAAAGFVTSLRNPLPAAGGVDPEDVEVVRRDAPEAFRTQERAVTAADYAAAAERRPDVQRAAASFRWTGSWHTVFVTPDRFGGGDIDAPYAARLRRHLERFRMAGYDLDVTAPRYVPLDVELHVCVKPDYFRGDVRRAVEVALSSGVQPNGELGHFHPDRFSFGEPVYLSGVIAAAQTVEGVDSVRVDRFRRMVDPDPLSLDEGVVTIGGLEIAQLANNPNFRERGRLTVEAGGGK